MYLSMKVACLSMNMWDKHSPGQMKAAHNSCGCFAFRRHRWSLYHDTRLLLDCEWCSVLQGMVLSLLLATPWISEVTHSRVVVCLLPQIRSAGIWSQYLNSSFHTFKFIAALDTCTELLFGFAFLPPCAWGRQSLWEVQRNTGQLVMPEDLPRCALQFQVCLQ